MLLGVPGVGGPTPPRAARPRQLLPRLAQAHKCFAVTNPLRHGCIAQQHVHVELLAGAEAAPVYKEYRICILYNTKFVGNLRFRGSLSFTDRRVGG